MSYLVNFNPSIINKDIEFLYLDDSATLIDILLYLSIPIKHYYLRTLVSCEVILLNQPISTSNIKNGEILILCQ